MKGYRTIPPELTGEGCPSALNGGCGAPTLSEGRISYMHSATDPAYILGSGVTNTAMYAADWI